MLKEVFLALPAGNLVFFGDCGSFTEQIIRKVIEYNELYDN
jgi:hypothetical protein